MRADLKKRLVQLEARAPQHEQKNETGDTEWSRLSVAEKAQRRMGFLQRNADTLKAAEEADATPALSQALLSHGHRQFLETIPYPAMEKPSREERIAKLRKRAEKKKTKQT